MTLKILHNPRCSKSRQTLDLLREKGFDPEIQEYLKTPPTAEELEDILNRLGMEPRAFMRRNEAEYKDNGLDDDSLSRAALIEAMVHNPKLIQRPVVITDDKAAIGRPPEAVLEIL